MTRKRGRPEYSDARKISVLIHVAEERARLRAAGMRWSVRAACESLAERGVEFHGTLDVVEETEHEMRAAGVHHVKLTADALRGAYRRAILAGAAGRKSGR
jgi:hypothetical protein